MTLLQFSERVSGRDQADYGNDPSFLDHVRSRASRALAERILCDASLYRRIDPTEDDLNHDPLAAVEHRWSIGIQTDKSELEARANQIDQARREGLREAAAFLRGQVSTYARADGACKHVLVSQLNDMASALERLSCEE